MGCAERCRAYAAPNDPPVSRVQPPASLTGAWILHACIHCVPASLFVCVCMRAYLLAACARERHGVSVLSACACMRANVSLLVVLSCLRACAVRVSRGPASNAVQYGPRYPCAHSPGAVSHSITHVVCAGAGSHRRVREDAQRGDGFDGAAAAARGADVRHLPRPPSGDGDPAMRPPLLLRERRCCNHEQEEA